MSVQSLVCISLLRPDLFKWSQDQAIRGAAECMDGDSTDPQLEKVMYLLEVGEYGSNTTDYLARLASLFHCVPLLRHLLLTCGCEVSIHTLMMVLLSVNCTESERLDTVKLLLRCSRNPNLPAELDYWALKYTLFCNKWDAFELLYSHFCRHSPTTDFGKLEAELCAALPESTQYSVLRDMRAIRRSRDLLDAPP